MKKSELKKRKYIPLAIKIVNIELESIMATGSGDHTGIGQGGTVGDAKQWYFSEEDEVKQDFHIGKKRWED